MTVRSPDIRGRTTQCDLTRPLSCVHRGGLAQPCGSSDTTLQGFPRGVGPRPCLRTWIPTEGLVRLWNDCDWTSCVFNPPLPRASGSNTHALQPACQGLGATALTSYPACCSEDICRSQRAPRAASLQGHGALGRSALPLGPRAGVGAVSPEARPRPRSQTSERKPFTETRPGLQGHCEGRQETRKPVSGCGFRALAASLALPLHGTLWVAFSPGQA